MRKKYTVLNGNRFDKTLCSYEDVWLFKPKDLLAAISINRLFRTTLTPLLWSVFVESAVKSLGNAYECMGNEEYDIPIDSVQKNNSAWAKLLILANPELRVLHWARIRKKSSWEKLKDFARHLKELRLTRCNSILLKRSKRDDTGKSRYTIITSMETGVEEFKTLEQTCRRIRLDNTFMEAFSVHRICLETLELDIRDDNYRDSFCNLGTILEQCSQRKHLAVAVPFYREPCARRQPLLFLDKLVTCPGLESLTLNGFRLAGENNHLHEGDEDYGSNEGTSRDSIEWDPEFEDYHDPQAYIFRPRWREVHLAFGSDACAGWCSAHFKRTLEALGFVIVSVDEDFTSKSCCQCHIKSEDDVTMDRRSIQCT
ncbi:hypothetical protein F5H01DRAFT_367214 [Linnemannia elongata]|nr:hypothetical protein F5H01DRAFT_367214 [Linnemannia elongata]